MVRDSSFGSNLVSLVVSKASFNKSSFSQNFRENKTIKWTQIQDELVSLEEVIMMHLYSTLTKLICSNALQNTLRELWPDCLEQLTILQVPLI